jgi:hypothetical protein
MKCCLVVPEICRGQVHGARKERIIIIIIIRNEAKTISLQTLFGRLNYTGHSLFFFLRNHPYRNYMEMSWYTLIPEKNGLLIDKICMYQF